MSKKTPSYLVILCNECNYYFGKHKKSKLNCPRCGSLQNSPQIYGRVDDSNSLHDLVSELNIPEELRSDFKNLNQNNEDINEPNNLIDLIPMMFNETTNSEGELTLVDVEKYVKKKNLKITPRELLEVCEFEGLLIRLHGEKWKVISESL
ncbi:MAG: hypothetical protein CMB48_00165 [Euryarchaeota archaeon]|nr:hypothetical protein [Euryarchaeota archaeon]|tara:strand:- start:73 stop:522 length:450 start_codon:yes stop_codon:yes gene_type:complete